MIKRFKYYNSLKFCSPFNFFESIEDERYLLILKNYMELPEISKKLKDKLLKIRTELSEQLQNFQNQQDNALLDLSKQLVREQADQQFILNSLNILRYKYSGLEADFKYFEDRLFAMGYEIKKDCDFEKEIQRLRKKAISKNNKIKRLSGDIEKLTELQENEGEKDNYLKIVLMIDSIANIKIDIYKDSMLTFIFAKNQMIEIIEQRKKLINKNAA